MVGGLVLVSFEVILGRDLAKCLKFKGYRSNSPVLRNGQDLGLTFRWGHNILCLLSIVTSVTPSKTAVFGVAFGFPLGPAHIGFPEPKMAASFTQHSGSFFSRQFFPSCWRVSSNGIALAVRVRFGRFQYLSANRICIPGIVIATQPQ